MTSPLSKYTTVLGVLVVTSIATFWSGNPVIGLIAALPVLLLEAGLLGFAENPERRFLSRLTVGGFLLIAWLVSAGAVLYVFLDLSAPAVLGLWIVTAVGSVYLAHLRGGTRAVITIPQYRAEHHTTTAIALTALVAVLDAIAFLLVTQGQTVEAIRSPWESVPSLFFVVFFFASLTLAALAYQKSRRLTLFAGVLHTFVAASVALTIYQLGYGFDPFIHQKVEELILQFGSVLPKTPYYLGQYALVTIISRFTHVLPNVIDRFLVPLGYATVFPLLAVWIAERATEKKQTFATFAIFVPLLIPFAPFINTTPQGLSYLFAVSTVSALFAWRAGVLSVWPAVLGVLATLAIHPVSGIPVLGLFFLSLPMQKMRWSKMLHPLSAVAGGALLLFGVPAAFLLNSFLSGRVQAQLSQTDNPATALFTTARDVLPLLQRTGNLFLDTPYIWLALIPFVLVALAVVASRNARPRWQQSATPTLLAAFLLVLSFFSLTFIRFGIGEDTGAATFPFRFRLIELAGLFLFPLASIGFAHLSTRLLRGPTTRLVTIFTLAALTTATVYLSYPRVDRIDPSKGYAVSSATQDAVIRIEDATEEPYIVLANQTATAAAIKHFGFVKYYNDNFYYSHPASAPDLYTFFLEMNTAASRETAQTAMDFAGVETLFFVVHDYWKGSARIRKAASKTADEVISSDGVTIFQYGR